MRQCIVFAIVGFATQLAWKHGGIVMHKFDMFSHVAASLETFSAFLTTTSYRHLQSKLDLLTMGGDMRKASTTLDLR